MPNTSTMDIACLQAMHTHELQLPPICPQSCQPDLQAMHTHELQPVEVLEWYLNLKPSSHAYA